VLTPQQQRDFRDLGYFNAGALFNPAELADIRAEYDRLLQHPIRIGEDGKVPFDYSPLLHVQSPLLCRYATHPALVRIAVELIGPNLRLWWDQAVAKQPGQTSEVPWHQDNGYAAIVPHEYATFTVGIDAHTAENGCLWIMPGSHKEGVKPHRRTDTLFFRGYEGDETGVAAPMGDGEVLVFSSLTMHRSGPNRSAVPRRSWVIQMCDADSRNPKTGVRFDDRLLVAKDGEVVAEPYRERDLDLLAALQG
jgi:ectoine hydroxylase-related dioxygenase (phytanoyl-CoA dioxygenase family)